MRFFAYSLFWAVLVLSKPVSLGTLKDGPIETKLLQRDAVGCVPKSDKFIALAGECTSAKLVMQRDFFSEWGSGPQYEFGPFPDHSEGWPRSAISYTNIAQAEVGRDGNLRWVKT